MCNKIAIGHNKQKEFFQRAIQKDRISHSYIFSGISGIGKKLFAINTAKALLCEENSFFTNCTCKSCTQIDNNIHPDLHIYDGKDLKIENIRGISEYADMTAFSGKWKIFILDEAELLSASAQTAAGNALLKTLEEPASSCLFLLITSKYELILPTIRSRCSLINFSPLSNHDMKNILTQHNIYSDSIIRKAHGSIEKALFLHELDMEDITCLLKEKNYKKFTKEILSVDNKIVLQYVLEQIYPLCLEKFKETGRYSYCQLGDYILEIIRNIRFNVSIDLVKSDLISKSVEVFSERV